MTVPQYLQTNPLIDAVVESCGLPWRRAWQEVRIARALALGGDDPVELLAREFNIHDAAMARWLAP